MWVSLIPDSLPGGSPHGALNWNTPLATLTQLTEDNVLGNAQLGQPCLRFPPAPWSSTSSLMSCLHHRTRTGNSRNAESLVTNISDSNSA